MIHNPPTKQVTSHSWKGVQKERSQLVQTMKHQGIFPDHDGNADWPHAKHIVCFEPHQIVRVEGGLQHDTQIDKVAKIQHKQFGFL